jgi:hypothetical protein
MILNAHGHKRTPNELAKELVLKYGEGAFFWQDRISDIYADKATDREVELIRDSIKHQYARVSRFLGDPDPSRDKED